MGIRVTCKYEQVKSNLKQGKPVHKCSVPQGSLKISIKKTVNKNPRQHSSRTDMIHEKFPSRGYNAISAAEELVKHVKCLVLPGGMWCLMFAHSGFPFYIKLRTRTFKSSGVTSVKFVLGFLSQIFIRSFPLQNTDRIFPFFFPHSSFYTLFLYFSFLLTILQHG